MKFGKIFSALCLMTALAVPSFSANAQEAQESQRKPNVYIDYFYYPEGVEPTESEMLRNAVIQALNDSKRVNLTDVASNDLLKIEEERRKAGASAGDDPERLKVMTQAGANFLLQGRINSWPVEKKALEGGGYNYQSVVNVTIKVINPNTGDLVLSESITKGNAMFDFSIADTPEEARMNVCKDLAEGKEIKNIVVEAFPLFGKILEVEEIKKDKIESVFIDLGSINGVAEKDKFEICLVRSIGGRKSLKVIGEMEIKAVEGDDISVAKVKKGHKELKAAMDGGQTIVVKSVPKGGGGFGGIVGGI